ncbi:hypothetical protein BJY01DRAFT_256059 [Aspergillus pseudoustus]|uniref:F-box domain-containing protein n=1 Tax=Aspergillus pseudoustus TaxID=1810923 RepID=A0ABR4IEN7_9EURO
MAESTPAPHRALLLPEILTTILLETDYRTLLKVQMVCRSWRDLVQSSPVLQVKLYYKPAITCPLISKRRSLNPFLIRSLTLSPDRRFDLPEWDRRNASWQKMLVCQPYVRSILVLEGRYDHLADLNGPADGSSLRATAIRFDPAVVHHADQLRFRQLRDTFLDHYILPVATTTRVKVRDTDTDADTGGKSRAISRVLQHEVLVVSRLLKFSPTFKALQGLFKSRFARSSADSFDLVFVPDPFDLVDRLTARKGAKASAGNLKARWHEYRAIEYWLELVEPWMRIEEQWYVPKTEL